ncbi:MAG: acyl-CoA dehydrogenase family protein [Candidatus Eiseniibacteriota bacterium]|nr:MAG: acyl-CoA dehydrogenase family protein [Candidatus Eisenbacteria bacterium]
MDFTIPKELELLKNMTRDLVKKELEPVANDVEEQSKIPEHLVEKMKQLGYFGLTVPPEYGGSGLGLLGYSLVIEELAKTHIAFFLLISTNNSIGGKPIVSFGNEEQKKKYLPRLATGEWRTAFALTEPEAGSDAASIKTTAVRDGDHFVLNGTKHFITGGPYADVFIVVALTDKKLRARGGISCFIVEKGTPGFSVGRVHRAMGLAGSQQSDLIFKNCRVPASNLLGKEGQGFGVAMDALDHGRIVAGADALGAAEKLLELSVEFAKQRVTFGKPIAERQAIQWMLADMATEIYATKMMLYHAAWKADQGEDVAREAAMVKLYGTEMANRVADKALQIHGGIGYMKEYPVERMYRDLRVTRIWEGTSEIQRLVIAKELLKES